MVTLLAVTSIAAQDADERVPRVLLRWAAAFDAGKIDLDGKIHADEADSL